jgi:hypothetical protein
MKTKRWLFFLIASIFPFLLKAQGNLQFNQVLLLSTTASSNTLLGTVPSGKVWKVEGFGTNATSYNSCGFSLDGVNTFIRTGGIDIYNGSYTYVVDVDNVWIPAGTPVWAMACTYNRWISVIEFNVVP